MYHNTRTLLQKQGLAPTKRLGQNFLVHRHTAERIVDLAGVQESDTVVEVGVGLGALTLPLADTCSRVIGFEADAGIIRMHREHQDLPGHVELRHEDVLKTDLTALADDTGGPLKLIANLPYSISSPFLFRLIKYCDCMDYAVLMLQKEVGERLLARVNTKQYGVPTVLLAICARLTLLMKVGAAEFHPRPKVDSVVVRLDFFSREQRHRLYGDLDTVLFKKLVNAAFGQRRKTLKNSLGSTGLLSSADLAAAMTRAAINPSARAGVLEPEAYVRLTREVADTMDAPGGERP
ncbi:MAG: ribosomal RNA small subunit methyltransferase A [Desulfobulbus propionicus]|nr:MAG: ribosomal RNA small subunit methyltransferase A [Desulfobulbus propionicus]